MDKLFSLELKFDDPLALASDIRAVIHDVDTTGVKMEIPLSTFVKALYLISHNYLESLQASEQLKIHYF